ncbi:MAG: phosphoenolpyruvate carboxykinase (ATP), partial [Pirellulales bacterium]|nr:phosphoenolpyruvate carboxykinase (ATP) [Pirellulales bacterium]
MNLRQHGISNLNVHHNLAPAALYEHAVEFDKAELTSSGAICNRSYEKTGRSPLDKRIVDN